MTGSNTLRSEELRSYVERVERLRSQKKVVADDERVVFAEAKAAGYATPYIKLIVKLRERTPSERDEHEAMKELYLSAMGMVRETPLFRHVESMGVDVAAREKVIEALSLLAPENGEFTVKIGDGARVRLWRDKDGVHTEEVRDAPPRPAPATPGRAAMQRPGENAPNCSEAEAVDLGRAARRADQPVIANPFAWDDPRRRRWDEGWREEDGGDGMGPR